MNWHELFRYDPETGNLFWKVKPCAKGRVYAGDEIGAGQPEHDYIRTSYRRKKYLAHRIIFEMFNGPIPEGMEVDHINRKRRDNRLSNLRLVNHRDNMRNMPRLNTNTSGVTGVCWFKRDCRWRAVIVIDRRQKHLGYFDSFEEAAEARKAAEIKYGFHKNHGAYDAYQK